MHLRFAFYYTRSLSNEARGIARLARIDKSIDFNFPFVGIFICCVCAEKFYYTRDALYWRLYSQIECIETLSMGNMIKCIKLIA